MRRAVLFVFLALATAALACGLTADFSGLRGGVRDRAIADANRDLDGEGGAVAQEDAADAGARDVSVGDAGFCALPRTRVKLCADFDNGAPLVTGWSQLDVYEGNIARVDGVAFSPPGGFFSSIRSSNGSPASARLLQFVPTLAPRVHMEFEMLLEPTNGDFEVCALHETTNAGVTYGVFYKEIDRQLVLFLRTLRTDGTELKVTRPIGAPIANWVHVEIDVTVADDGSIVVKHDGALVVNEPHLQTSTQSRASMFVELGFYSFVGASGQAHFDNVIVDWD